MFRTSLVHHQEENQSLHKTIMIWSNCTCRRTAGNFSVVVSCYTVDKGSVWMIQGVHGTVNTLNHPHAANRNTDENDAAAACNNPTFLLALAEPYV
jgi:hypothetical protein